MTRTNSQAGFVSLFTTIFFMLLITVITLGFLAITTTEQQQATNNDLSASALASAQSGIEDGKRAILKYMSLPAGATKTTYYTQMTTNSSSCTSITGSQIGSDLGLSSNGNVVNNSQINQSYTCLTVNLNSPDFISQSSAGTSQVVPLRAVGGSYQQIKVSWHLLSTAVGDNGDGLPGNPPGSSPYYAAGPLLYPQINSGTPSLGWNKLGYPAYMRVQLFGYPSSGNFTRDDLTQRSRSVLLVPSTGGTSSTTAINLGTADPNPGVMDQAELQPITIKCDPSPASDIGSYACTALLELPNGGQFTSTANNYYLRITPIYGATHFRVALVNSGAEVNLDQVQPVVDATGRAADVFRRLQARVLVNQLTNLPEFAAESATTICKNLQVTNNTADFVPNNCP